MQAQSQLSLDHVRTLRVDGYRASEPAESDRWATTDRGWIYDPEHPDRDAKLCKIDGAAPIGNYLDYGPCGEHYRARAQGAVHAVLTPWRVDPVTGRVVYTVSDSTWCSSVEAAQEWIEKSYRAWLNRSEDRTSEG